MAKVKAVLFDMDGLVLDTEKLYTRFWQEAAKAHGYAMTREQALGMRSLNRGAGAAKLASYFGEGVDYDAIRKTRIGLMEAFIEEEGVEVKPGLEVLLSYLKVNYQIPEFFLHFFHFYTIKNNQNKFYC